jgi:hypothetical protein
MEVDVRMNTVSLLNYQDIFWFEFVLSLQTSPLFNKLDANAKRNENVDCGECDIIMDLQVTDKTQFSDPTECRFVRL